MTYTRDISVGDAADWVRRRACRDCRGEAQVAHPGCVKAHDAANLILELASKIPQEATPAAPKAQ